MKKSQTHFTVYAGTSTTPRRIVAADEEDTRVKDMLAALDDDFSYALDGFEKMARDGHVAEALSIMTNLSEAINNAIQDTASQLS